MFRFRSIIVRAALAPLSISSSIPCCLFSVFCVVILSGPARRPAIPAYISIYTSDACYRGQVGAIELLCQRGADPNTKLAVRISHSPFSHPPTHSPAHPAQAYNQIQIHRHRNTLIHICTQTCMHVNKHKRRHTHRY